MNKGVILFFLWLLPVFMLQGDVLEDIDVLHEAYNHAGAVALAEKALPTASGGRMKGELYWRLSRATLYLGDTAEDEGMNKKELLEIFERAEEWGEKGIQADPSNPHAYFWKSAAIGRWGQAKGILDSLGKAKPMRELLQQAMAADPEHVDSYKVLGQLYRLVPGMISFGDKEFAVSFGRKARDLMESQIRSGTLDSLQFDVYLQLAESLWARDWKESKRSREMSNLKKKWDREPDPFEKFCYYEASVSLPSMSDREEALDMVKMVIRELKKISNPSTYRKNELADAEKLLEDWQ